MKTNLFNYAVLFIFLCSFGSVMAQSAASESTDDKSMKTYLIERDIPDAGKLSMAELVEISQKSCSVLEEMGPQIQWLHSYVTENKIYCIYKAMNEEMVLEHAAKGGFPANYITELSTIISPETAKQ